MAVWHSLSESNGSAAGGDGAARNPLQEVEQDHGCYCDLPRGADLLIEARQWSEFGLCRSPGGVLLSVEVVGGVRLQQLILRSETEGGARLL